MSSIGEALKTYVTASTSVNDTIGGRMHQHFPPNVSTVPHIAYGRSGEQQELYLDGSGGLRTALFDIECVGATADAAIDLAADVKARLHGASSTAAGVTLKAVFVEDHDDDYLPKSIGDDSGKHVAALNIKLLYTT